jgi:hypothetical protein
LVPGLDHGADVRGLRALGVLGADDLAYQHMHAHYREPTISESTPTEPAGPTMSFTAHFTSAGS